jgi:hypothetical protein
MLALTSAQPLVQVPLVPVAQAHGPLGPGGRLPGASSLALPPRPGSAGLADVSSSERGRTGSAGGAAGPAGAAGGGAGGQSTWSKLRGERSGRSTTHSSGDEAHYERLPMLPTSKRE